MILKNHFDYPSKRVPIIAENGMVATGQPLASEKGLDIMKKGGNAVDAAIATAALLTVLEPTANGLGGDAFVIVEVEGKLYGLNGSGKSPEGLTLKDFENDEKVPVYGFKPQTVPGAVHLWKTLHQKFGKLPFEEILKPAIECAENGYLLSFDLAHNYQRAYQIYEKNLKDPLFQSWFETFKKPSLEPGTKVYFKDHAKTLKAIAKSYGDDFYHGDIMKKIVRFHQENGGYFKERDFKNHDTEWVTPIGITIDNATLYELPPNGQGIIALKALGIYSHTKKDLHHQIESLKHAFISGKDHISDSMSNSEINAFLDSKTLKNTALSIPEEASDLTPSFNDHGTVYLATSDPNMSVSFIQSNYMGFGSGIVIPGTGIAMHNRGANFTLKNHPNQYAPLKRPYHTIIPGFIKHKDFYGPFGIMGGFMQPQAHFQVFNHIFEKGLNIQQALDHPRWLYQDHKTILFEKDYDQDAIDELIKKGHDVTITDQVGLFGRGQIIFKYQGFLVGATEKRTDGRIAFY